MYGLLGVRTAIRISGNPLHLKINHFTTTTCTVTSSKVQHAHKNTQNNTYWPKSLPSVRFFFIFVVEA